MGVCVIQNRSSAEAVPSSLCGFNAAVGVVGCALYVPFMQSHLKIPMLNKLLRERAFTGAIDVLNEATSPTAGNFQAYTYS
jgi:hypothetical protein